MPTEPTRAATGDHEAPHGVERLGEPVDGRIVELGAVLDHRVPRTPIGPTRRQRPRIADERIAEREVELHGTGTAPARSERLGNDARAQRSPRVTSLVGRHPGVDEPAHRPSVEVGLVDRLWCGDSLQLGRTVGGRGDQRHAALVGLDDRGMQLDRRSAAAREHDRGSAGREPEPERDERGTALVVMHVDCDP